MDEGRKVTGYGLREDKNMSMLYQSVATKFMGSTMNNHESMTTQEHN